MTFKLKKNAKFQDGTPVTSKDVKWSFDRSIGVGGFPRVQMKAGSLEKPEQFVAVDDQTFRVDFLTKNHLTIPDIAVIVPGIYNSQLLKSKATEKDPWALEYTKSNTAGSGAYKVTSWKPGVENGTLTLLAWMIEDGFGDHLMLGMDAARQGYWTTYGGTPGWTFLLGEFAERMQRLGITADAQRAIFVTNPARAFAFAKVP